MTEPGSADTTRHQEEVRLFVRFVREHESDLTGFIMRLIGNREDAEEIAQESFLRLYETLGKLEPGVNSYLAWAYRVAKNLSIDHLRKKREVILADEHLERAVDADAVRPEEVYEHRATASLIRDALQTLPHNYREVLVLRFQSELSYEQIAEVLGVPVSTVETRIHRAKKMLRVKLKRTMR